MNLVVALLVATFGALVVWSSPTGDTTHHTYFKVADKDLLEKQRKVLSLFRHINQHCHNEEHEEIIKTFKLAENKDNFTNIEAVNKLIEHYTKGSPLAKGEIFSISYPEHLEEAILLFELLYYAKDFDTFYKTSVTARHWKNEGLFLYSYSVAIIHRPDCYGVILPPIYEIYPHFFFNVDTIHQAYRYKQTWDHKKTHTTSGKYPGYTIHSNYSGHYLNIHPEQSLSYYLEDVGINSFYYTYFLYYPFWMSGTKYNQIFKDRRGELYYFVHQQLFARYYLERLSNGFGQITTLDFDVPVETSFYPSLQYPNGLAFPERPRFARLSDYFYTYGEQVKSRFGYSYILYHDFSRRIVDAVDRGYAFNKNGEKVELYNHKVGYEHLDYEVLGNLLQSNPDSPDNHYYGPWLGYGRHLLGYSYTPLSKHKVAPSALEHLETTLRDPGFYQLYKDLILNYVRYQVKLKPYTRDELTFPGVSIEKVEIDQLITYFDEFYSDLSQAVFYSEEELKHPENEFFVRAKQYRLNHKPFNYKIRVKSDKDVKAVVKIFIGPKQDEYGRQIFNINENRFNFFELDKFIVDLKTGDHTIERSSQESKFFDQDKTGYHDLYKQVFDALDGNFNQQFTINGKENYISFPSRYMIPKGTQGGLPFEFYFIVYPFKPYTGNKPEEWTFFYPRPGMGGPYVDDYSLFYPFDRPIKYERVFREEIPNAFFQEAIIYHKKDVNAVLSDDN